MYTLRCHSTVSLWPRDSCLSGRFATICKGGMLRWPFLCPSVKQTPNLLRLCRSIVSHREKVS